MEGILKTTFYKDGKEMQYRNEPMTRHEAIGEIQELKPDYLTQAVYYLNGDITFTARFKAYNIVCICEGKFTSNK